MSENDYLKYRGKCKEYVDELVNDNPELVAVRGYYYCPFWGKQEHWWAKDKSGHIIDPTAKQFPSNGFGEYEEFDGVVECAQCGKRMKEEDAQFYGRYAFCSHNCIGIFIGVY